MEEVGTPDHPLQDPLLGGGGAPLPPGLQKTPGQVAVEEFIKKKV